MKPPHPIPRELRPGYVGRDVAVIQSALHRSGVRSYPGTGRWQSPTTIQVKAFQAAHGIPESGIVGRKTWDELYRFLTPFGKRYMRDRYAALHPPAPSWREAAVAAAFADYQQRDLIGYTQSAARWNGVLWVLGHVATILKGGHVPPITADCSAKYTQWALTGMIRASRSVPATDSVNGLKWRAGYTGTMVRVMRWTLRPRLGDAVIYGPGTGRHTAMVVSVAQRTAIGHGSESGPHLLPISYRADFSSFRSPEDP